MNTGNDSIAYSRKRYDRCIGQCEDDSLTKIAERIPEGSRVLDVGTGPGSLGYHLTEEKNCSVFGIEIDPAFVTEARDGYEHLFIADLNKVDLATALKDLTFEYVVCADILEHLFEPAEVLKQLTAFLSPEGKVLISIPNVGYLGLVAELAAGSFLYRDEGLLDRTHIRFFVRGTLSQMIESCGLVKCWENNVSLPLDRTEFDAKPAANYIDLDALAGREDALTYQFVWELAKQG